MNTWDTNHLSHEIVQVADQRDQDFTQTGIGVRSIAVTTCCVNSRSFETIISGDRTVSQAAPASQDDGTLRTAASRPARSGDVRLVTHG
jgi:hypothetical protein